jgi:hypothetical protein
MVGPLRPEPVTLADELVAAVHDRLAEQNDLLRQLLDRMAPLPVERHGDGGAVLVTEPAPSPRAVAKKTVPAKKADATQPPLGR